jgi:hypothetical protein
VEAALGQILRTLNPSVEVARRTAGQLARDVRRKLGDYEYMWEAELLTIEEAIRRRNHAVHTVVTIGSVYREYATGDGGDWIPVIGLMGSDLYDESDLLEDLALQQEATACAVRLLQAALDGDLETEPPSPGWTLQP